MICVATKLALDSPSPEPRCQCRQWGIGARRGQQMSPRILLCTHRSPNSLSLLRLPKLGLVGWEKSCLFAHPLQVLQPQRHGFVVLRFLKPRPKLRKWFLKIKKGKARQLLCAFRTFHDYLQPLRKGSNVTHGGTQHFRSLLIGKMINIAGILVHSVWENGKMTGRRFCLQVQFVLTRGKSANEAVPAGLHWHVSPWMGSAEARALLAGWPCIILCV